MNAIVDFLSFTIPLNLAGVGWSPDVDDLLCQHFTAMGLSGFMAVLAGSEPIPKPGRAHYGAGLFWPALHISLWWGNIANHVLVEVAGMGCQALRDSACLDETVTAIAARCTRLDIAVDFTTEAKPADFVKWGHSARFSARSSITSSEGDTEYIGSPKSDRFARVYKYAEPHPRSHTLRVEHVLRSDYAKAGAKVLRDEGLINLVTALGNSFGWKSPLWTSNDITVGKLKSQLHDRSGASTILWLERQVRPALQKAHKSGLVDVKAWLEEILKEL